MAKQKKKGEGRLPGLSLKGLDLEAVLGAVMLTPPPAESALPRRPAKKARKRRKAKK